MHEEVEMIEGSAKAVSLKACKSLPLVNNLDNFTFQFKHLKFKHKIGFIGIYCRTEYLILMSSV